MATFADLLNRFKKDNPVFSHVTSGIARDMSQGFRSIPENIQFARQMPEQFAKGVDLSTGEKGIGRLATKASEGVGEGMTFGTVDIPVRPSENIAETGAYLAGFGAGTFVSPISKMAQLLSKTAPIEIVQKDLGRIAGRNIAKGGMNKILGTGIRGISQGLPFNLAYQGARQLTPDKNTAGSVAGDFAFDAALSSVPFGMLLSKATKGKGDDMLGAVNKKLDTSKLDKLRADAKNDPEYQKSVSEFSEKLSKDKLLNESMSKVYKTVGALETERKNLWKKWHETTDKKVKESIQNEVRKIDEQIKQAKVEEKRGIIDSMTPSEPRSIGDILGEDTAIGKVYKEVEMLNRQSAPEAKTPKPGVLDDETSREMDKIIGGLGEQVKARKKAVAESDVMSTVDILQKQFDEIIDKKYANNAEFFENYKTGKIKDEDLKAITSEAAKIYETVTGKPINKIDAYLPQIHPDSKGYQMLVTGDDMFSIADAFDPSKGRADVEGYIPTAKEAMGAYFDTIRYHTNKAQIDAKNWGVTEESAKKIQDVAEEIGKRTKEKGISDVNIVDSFQEIGKFENAVNGTIPSKIAIKSVKGWKLRQLVDPFNVFSQIGLHPNVLEMVNKHTRVGHVMESLKEPVINKDAKGITKVLYEQYPNQAMPHFNMEEYFKKMVDEGFNLERSVYSTVSSLQDKEAQKQLIDTVSRIEFPDEVTKDYVNDQLNYLITRSNMGDRWVDHALAAGRKMNTLGFMGLNFVSAILNLSEVRRLPGSLDRPQDALMAIGQTLTTKNGYANKYGIDEDAVFREKLAKNDVLNNHYKKASKILGKGADGLMYMFSQTEKAKNEVFLRAYEQEAIEKGLQGKEAQDYVLSKFYKYSHYMSKYTLPEAFQNKYTKTIFQFSQYPTKDLYLTLRKAKGLVGKADEEKSAQYLINLAITGVATAYIFKQIGLNPMNAMIATPLGISNMDLEDSLVENARFVSPYAPLIIDPAMIVADYLNGENTYEGTDIPNGQGRVADYLERRLEKDITGRIPAGTQLINKTGGFAKDYARGFSSTTNKSDPKVRFPVEQGDISTIIKGGLFGTGATQYSSPFWDAQNNLPEGKYANLSGNETDIYNSIPNQKDAIDYWQRTFNDKVGANNALATGEAQAETGSNDMVTMNGLLAQDALMDQKYSEMRSYENVVAQGMANGSIDESQYEELLTKKAQELGWSYKGYREKQLSSSDIPVETKAKLVQDSMMGGEFDLANAYKTKLLTLSVAKELERMGVIPDANDLWDKAKMTDVYYQNEEMRKLREKANKAQTKMMQDIILARSDYEQDQFKASSDLDKDIQGILSKSRKKTAPKLSPAKRIQGIGRSNSAKPSFNFSNADLKPSSDLFPGL